jgi:hypothetical protein
MTLDEEFAKNFQIRMRFSSTEPAGSLQTPTDCSEGAAAFPKIG